MSAPASTGGKAPTSGDTIPDQDQPGLKRELKNRHIQMIALGGAIGTGLFYGSADSIKLAGPAILLAYLIGGAVTFLVVRALGEMLVHEPVSGAFTHYAYKNWSHRAGFVSGWNYWFLYVAVAMAELAAAGIYVNYWFSGAPRWLTAAFFLVAITAVNLLGVRAYGEFEFWFALIKVAAVIGMIVLGVVVVVLDINHNPKLPDPSFGHLVNNGGFFPHGVSGMLSALVVVVFSFGGIELIGITAGEAADPKRTIPKAINQVIYRILIFYVGALAIIMAVVPWTSIDGKESPFVQIFDNIGVRGAADILNLVVLTAAMSVYNSGLYSNGRMLYSLAQQGNAPKYLLKVSKQGSPIAGILTSSAVTVVAVVVVMGWPNFAFKYLMSVATIGVVITWSIIMITEWTFRRRIGPEAARKLEFKLPGGNVTTWVVLAFLAFVIVLMTTQSGYQTAVIIGPLWLAALLVAYEVKRRRQAEPESIAPAEPELAGSAAAGPAGTTH